MLDDGSLQAVRLSDIELDMQAVHLSDMQADHLSDMQADRLSDMQAARMSDIELDMQAARISDIKIDMMMGVFTILEYIYIMHDSIIFIIAHCNQLTKTIKCQISVITVC